MHTIWALVFLFYIAPPGVLRSLTAAIELRIGPRFTYFAVLNAPRSRCSRTVTEVVTGVFCQPLGSDPLGNGPIGAQNQAKSPICKGKQLNSMWFRLRSAIDSAQNDQTMVLQSLQATKQANVEKIRHLWGP